MGRNRDRRLEELLKHIRVKGSTSVEELAEMFGVSTATIRRDIKILESDNEVLRTVGGGIVSLDGDTVNGEEKPGVAFIEEKIRIAEYCIGLVEEHDEIMIGPGSTAFLVGRIFTGISDRRFRIITNSLELAMEASRSTNLDGVILGGEVYSKYSAGFTAHHDYFSTCHHQHKAIISADGIDITAGLTLFDPRFLAILQNMIKVSREVILVADSSKIGRSRYNRVAALDRVTLMVTDTGVPAHFLRHMESLSVPVVQV